MDEQILLTDENPDALEKITYIDVHEEGVDGKAPYSGRFAVLGQLPEGIGPINSPAGLPQRIKQTRSMPNDSPSGGGTKRALPFTTTPVKDTKGKKAAKQSTSQPSSPTKKRPENMDSSRSTPTRGNSPPL